MASRMGGDERRSHEKGGLGGCLLGRRHLKGESNDADHSEIERFDNLVDVCLRRLALFGLELTELCLHLVEPETDTPAGGPRPRNLRSR